MRIEKDRLKVEIFLADGSTISGIVHINPGERLQDFINDSRKSFIAVTGIEGRDIILNKTLIKWICEAQ